MELQSSGIPAHLVEGPLILSIDIGSSAVKVLFFDIKGRAVEGNQYRCADALRISRDGASEVAADELLDIVCRGIDAVLAKAGSLEPKVAGVAICTFVGNIMGVDRKANPPCAGRLVVLPPNN